MPTWTQDLAIGIPAIDEQHREVFVRAQTLLAAMKQRTPTEVGQLVNFLGEHCSHHFRSEESVMRALGHARLREHCEQHAVFIGRFQEIVDLFAAKGPSIGVTIEIQDYLGLLVKHIRSEDAALVVAERPERPQGGVAPRLAGHSAHDGPLREDATRMRRNRAATSLGGGRCFQPDFIQYAGKRILRLDFAGLSRSELLEAFVTAGQTIAAEPPASLRILTLLAASLDAESAEAFKRYAIRNRAHVFASAIVATSFWNVMVTDLHVRGRKDLMLFDHETDALDWLANR